MIYSRFLLSILYILVCVCNQLVRVAEDTIGVLCVCVCVCVCWEWGCGCSIVGLRPQSMESDGISG